MAMLYLLPLRSDDAGLNVEVGSLRLTAPKVLPETYAQPLTTLMSRIRPVVAMVRLSTGTDGLLMSNRTILSEVPEFSGYDASTRLFPSTRTRRARHAVSPFGLVMGMLAAAEANGTRPRATGPLDRGFVAVRVIGSPGFTASVAVKLPSLLALIPVTVAFVAVSRTAMTGEPPVTAPERPVMTTFAPLSDIEM